MSEEWRERRARNAINSTEAEGVNVSTEAKHLGLAISRGEIDADTAVAEYWRTTSDND